MNILTLLQTIATLLTATLTQATRTAKLTYDGLLALKGYVDLKSTEIAAAYTAAIAAAIEPVNTTLSGHTSTLANHGTRIGVLESGQYGHVEEAVVHAVVISGTSSLTTIFANDFAAQLPDNSVKPNATYILFMDSDVEGEETVTYPKSTLNGVVNEDVTVSGGEKFVIKTDANGAVKYALYVRDPNAEALIDIKNGMSNVQTVLTNQNALLLAQNEQLNTLVVTLQGLVPN